MKKNNTWNKNKKIILILLIKITWIKVKKNICSPEINPINRFFYSDPINLNLKVINETYSLLIYSSALCSHCSHMKMKWIKD